VFVSNIAKKALKGKAGGQTCALLRNKEQRADHSGF
jgi:hypothetical protein